MKVNVNPATEAGGFGYAEAGEYKLRVVAVSLNEGQKAPYLKWELEFVDPNVKAVEEGKKPGHIFENTTLKDDAQFTLRALVEALGLTWGDFETEECIGMELDAKVAVNEFCPFCGKKHVYPVGELSCPFTR